MPEEEKNSLPVPAEGAPQQGELFSANDLVKLEQARIASFDRRTDVAKAAIDADRESDKRQFEFAMERLRTDSALNQRRHEFGSKFLWVLLGAVLISGAFLMRMIFYGEPAQIAMAYKILVTLFTGSGGAGIFVLIRQIWRKLQVTNNHQ